MDSLLQELKSQYFSLLEGRTAEQAEVDELCARYGNDVKVRDGDGWTLIHAAVRTEKVEFVKHVISKGADVNAEGKYGRTPLHVATQYNKNVEVARYLVSNGADVSAKDWSANTPLHFAAYDNVNVEFAQFFVSEGADVNAKDNDSKTPLDLAREEGNTAVVEYLVSIASRRGHHDNGTIAFIAHGIFRYWLPIALVLFFLVLFLLVTFVAP
jgi:ankyrin repeat protein